MSKKNPSVILYAIAGILYFLSVLIDSEYLTLLAKPILIPSMLVFYYLESKGKINNMFLLSLISFFVGDMLYLINLDEYFTLGLFVFLVPYFVISFFLIQDIFKLIKRKKINKLNLSFLIILFFLIYLVISILSVLETNSDVEFVYFFVFGIELVLMGILVALIFINENSKVNFFIVLSVSLFIISDISFILNKNLFPLLIFKLVNVSSQTFSYYFYTRYFVERQKSLKYSNK